MKWFRFYSEVIHDPKVQRLHPALFKHWINLLCLASESEDRGVLPSIEDVAFALRVKPAKAKVILAQLTDGGLLDITPDGRYEHHGWTQRQRESDDVASRVRQHRVTKSTVNERTLDADSTLDEREPNDSASTESQEEINSSADISGNDDECNVTTALPETLPKRPVDTDTETDTELPLASTAREPSIVTSPNDLAIQEAADILSVAAWVGDDPSDVLKGVRRSFELVPLFDARDGPVEAEKFVRWHSGSGRRKRNPPDDWYRAWLNWIKKAISDEHQPQQNGRTPSPSGGGGGEDFDAYVGIARQA